MRSRSPVRSIWVPVIFAMLTMTACFSSGSKTANADSSDKCKDPAKAREQFTAICDVTAAMNIAGRGVEMSEARAASKKWCKCITDHYRSQHMADEHCEFPGDYGMNLVITLMGNDGAIKTCGQP